MLIEKIQRLSPTSLTTKIVALFLVICLFISSHIALQIVFNAQSKTQLKALQKSLSDSPNSVQLALQNFKRHHETQQFLQVLMLIIITIFILLIGFNFSRLCIINPINLLINNFKRLAQGEENIVLRIDRDDEFGQLGACFNEININLQQAMSTWELVMESEAEKAAISDAALDGIVTLDKDLMISSLNSAADKMLEVDNFDMSSQYFPDIAFIENEREAYTKQIYLVSDEVSESIFKKITEINITGKDSNVFPAEISVASVLQKGEPIYIIYIRDNTLHKKSEYEMQKSRDAAVMQAHKLSDFMANISHEIRTPMNGIMGVLSVLDRQLKLPTEQQTYLNAAIDSADRLHDVVNNIISFTQLDSTSLKITKADFSLSELVNIIYNLNLKKFTQKNLKFTIHTADNCPLSIHSDPSCIARCLDLLLDNALKFTHQGKVSLTIELDNSHQNSMIAFNVTDTGCGILEKNQERIFEPFTQADASRSRSYDGAGIGLYMCKQITEILEGNLSLISEKDKGSRFILSIPYTKALTDNLISLNSLITHTEQDASDLADAIDMKQLSNTLNIFSDAEKKIFYNSVSQSIEEISPQLKQAIYDKNTVIATQLINKLKGAYSNIHATRLIAYCDTLETSLLSGITEDEINKQLNEVEYETKKTLQAVENLIL